MVLADMANLPEHDFAPAWLKIPSHQQQSSKPPHVNDSHGGRLGPPDEHHDRYRSRHYATDTHYAYGRSPTVTPDQFGFRGRDERRHYSNAANRHHSVDDLPWDPDPTTNWNVSQFNGHTSSSSTYGTGYSPRGSSVPRNGQQYSSNGRFDGTGFASSRGQFHQGKPAGQGRHRYNSGPKSGYSEREDHTNDTPTKEEGQGDGLDDAGKESDNKSALSNQDFPSLSGAGDDVEMSVATKKSIPSGAWEKPPGTTKVISGRKVQLIKKSIASSSESKSAPRTITPSSSTSTGDGSAGSKVGGQTGSASQTSKAVAASNVSSSIVLKSMTSVTPMVSSRNKESAIRSAPMPSSRISPVPSKPLPVSVPSRSTPITINPPPTNVNKAPINMTSTNKPTVNKALVSRSPINKSPISSTAVPTTRSSLLSITSPGSHPSSQLAPAISKAEPSADNSMAGSVANRAASANVKSMTVVVDSSKNGAVTEKPAPTAAKPIPVSNMSATLISSKPKAITNMSTTLAPAKNPSITNKPATHTPSKPTTVTNMSSTLIPSKPTSITNMSTVVSNRPTPALVRPASTPNRPTVVGGRSAPVFGRPSPVSSTRPSVTIINRPIPAPVGGGSPTPISLRSGPASSLSNRKEKAVIPIHASTLKPLTKEPPSSHPTPSAPFDMPLPSPATPKPKKGDKLVFLNELRRCSNGDLPKEVSQNNRDNLREKEECDKNGPISQPKTILKREHHDIKMNGIDIHNDFEKGSEEDGIPNFYPVFSPVKDVPDMSSSLEAEKRLLQEMGWHEHSDNEEGYAPLTEDELKEFQKKSQQLKKNGLTRTLPTAFNSVNLSIGSITQVSLEDGFTSSDSDSSDDEQS